MQAVALMMLRRIEARRGASRALAVRILAPVMKAMSCCWGGIQGRVDESLTVVKPVVVVVRATA